MNSPFISSFAQHRSTRRALLAFVGGLLLCLAQPAFGQAVALGDATSFGLFSIGGDISISGATSIYGNIGIDPAGCSSSYLSVSGTSSIANGAVYVEPPTYLNNTSSKWHTGLTQSAAVSRYVDQASADAKSASTLAYNLGQSSSVRSANGYSFGLTKVQSGSGAAVSGSFGSIGNSTGGISILKSGSYVFNISNLVLTANSTFQLTAPAGTKVVFDITGNFSLNGGSLLLAGGIQSSNVIYNYTGTKNITIGSTATGVKQSVVQGDILAPTSTVTVTNSSIQGRIIAQDICLSGTNVVSSEYQQTIVIK